MARNLSAISLTTMKWRAPLKWKYLVRNNSNKSNLIVKFAVFRNYFVEVIFVFFFKVPRSTLYILYTTWLSQRLVAIQQLWPSCGNSGLKYHRSPIQINTAGEGGAPVFSLYEIFVTWDSPWGICLLCWWATHTLNSSTCKSQGANNSPQGRFR